MNDKFVGGEIYNVEAGPCFSSRNPGAGCPKSSRLHGAPLRPLAVKAARSVRSGAHVTAQAFFIIVRINEKKL